MPIAEARVPTNRPSRYLVQLCKHFSNKGRHLGHRARSHNGGDAVPPAGMHMPPDLKPDQIHVEWSETQGVLSLPWGRCTLDAEADALMLRAEADDEEGLRRLQDLLEAHIGRFGRRDELRVDWQQPDRPAAERAEAAGATAPPAASVSARRGRLTWAGITVLGVLAVAVHLGLAGAVLSGPRWTGWVVGAVLAVIVVKITALTVFGRRVHRRSREQAG
ncbi:hypothetical protein GCM10011579_064170 [Streptomyces albiflavescens]|uniref:DUF2218 domain-containing protein n=1 Tax=Streptomyces albiflavescens TaxID=1623582 RepID=A0A918D780_9ACTN|nr:DUF2218 domain-containing protein [Streptomyces albiflavescens]GGN79561.1 hypothetical protein GCM10011579_064170 [Streptomyces albiflavescens]